MLAAGARFGNLLVGNVSIKRGRRPVSTSPIDWFMTRVRKTKTCWIWEGYSKNKRYGSLKLNGCVRQAHVHAYLLFNGPLDAGKEVCHSCDVPLCVNPAHLFLATHSQNLLDSAAKGRAFTRERGNIGRRQTKSWQQNFGNLNKEN
jgi:hypothetical protein